MRAFPRCGLSYTGARFLSGELVAVVSYARNLAVDLFDSRRFDEADALLDVLAHVRADAQYLAVDLDGKADVEEDLDRADRLVEELAHARYRADHFADDFNVSARLRDLIHDLDEAIARARHIAVRLVYDLETAYILDRKPFQGRGQGAWPTARCLLAVAIRILPSADRTRYGEEFRSELTEIARAGGGHCVQLAYASRQVMSAARLSAVP